MDDTTVPDLTGYPAVAEDLRRIADLLDKAADVPLPKQPWIRMNIQPGGDDDEQVIARTDALAAALFGATGQVSKMTSGTYHYDAEGQVGAVRVHVYDSISEATVFERDRARELAEKEAELERLRAEVAELRAGRPVETLTCGWCPTGQAEPESHPGGQREHQAALITGRLVLPVDEPGLIVGDTADEQRDNAYAAYERDEAEYLPVCPECMGQHHTVEPCR